MIRLGALTRDARRLIMGLETRRAASMAERAAYVGVTLLGVGLAPTPSSSISSTTSAHGGRHRLHPLQNRPEQAMATRVVAYAVGLCAMSVLVQAAVGSRLYDVVWEPSETPAGQEQTTVTETETEDDAGGDSTDAVEPERCPERPSR